MLLLHWHPNTKLSREAEKERLLPWLVPAKTNSVTSEHAVLLDWICLPARFCQRPAETKREKEREIWNGKLGSLALPDAHLPPWRDKRQSQRVQGSKIIPPFSSPHLSSLPCSPGWQMLYIVMSFKAGGKWTYCGFQIPRLPGDQLNKQNPKNPIC